MEVEREEAENKSKKLCFKLKISPKTEPTTTDDHHDPHDDHDDDQEDQDQNLLLPFECLVCKQRFKSGKALGGHKRIHKTNDKNNKVVGAVEKTNKKRKSSETIDEDEDEEEEHEPVCPICRKSFPSKKSLFGHMRSHPGRGWRGIQPPQPAAAEDDHRIDDHVDDDEDVDVAEPRAMAVRPSDSPKTPACRGVDLAISLKKQGNWSVTAKRGSGAKSSSSSSSSAVPVMGSSMKEAVIDLMVFAHQKPNARAELLSILQRIRDNKKREEQEEEEEEEEEEEDEEEEEEEEEEEGEENEEEAQENSAAERIEEYIIMQRIKNKNEMKKTRKKMKLADLEEDDKTSSKAAKSGEYICSVCKKSFQSYQALGGHASSHKKNKNNIKTNNDLPSTNRNDDGDEDGGGDQSVGGGRKVLDFDLNELPPLDD